MKKLFLICICFSFLFSFSGCALTEVLEPYLPTKDTVSDDSETIPHQRVYMDELIGVLENFDGTTISLKSDGTSYSFDVSEATIECKNGIVLGDEISVIYEGKFEYGDTSSVKVLKVADAFHGTESLKDTKLEGELLSCSSNNMIIKTKDNQKFQLSTTGVRQYYQNGLNPGNIVYVHYKGILPDEPSEKDTIIDGTHLKILTISDIEPLTIPTPTPVPSDFNPEDKIKKFSGRVKYIDNNILEIILKNSDTSLKLDISSIKSYFKGGIAPGTALFISYKGDFDGSTTKGIELLQIVSENADKLTDKEIYSYILGTIIGSTKNTVTLQTNDGIIITCNIENVIDNSSNNLVHGSGVKAYFNPSKSKTTNVFTCVRIEDA